MPEFKDLKAGDRIVATNRDGARYSGTVGDIRRGSVNCQGGISLWEHNGWTIESIEKMLPTEPGSRINNVVTLRSTYPFAVRTFSDAPEDYYEWAAFPADSDYEGIDSKDIKSWESA